MLNFKPKPVVPHKVTFFHTITLCGEVRTVRFQDPIQFKHVCMLLHCGCNAAYPLLPLGMNLTFVWSNGS